MSNKQFKKKRSKKRQSNQKPRPTNKKQKQSDKITKRQHLKRIFSSGFSLFVVFVSVVSALYVFYPRVSIVTSEQLFPYNPFKNPFYVYNSGSTPITNFEYHYFVERIELAGGITFTDVLWYREKTTRISNLGPERKRYLSLEILDVPPSQVEKASIEINYSYGLPFIPYIFKNKSSFKVEKTSTGRYVWFDNN